MSLVYSLFQVYSLSEQSTQSTHSCYRFINFDRSNFLHVFFKDPLWLQLPLDCVVEILKHVKTHTDLPYYDSFNNDWYLNAVSTSMNNIYPAYIGAWTVKRNSNYKTPNYVSYASITINQNILHSTPKERKKKYNIYKKKIARTKDYRRQPNRAMRKR